MKDINEVKAIIANKVFDMVDTSLQYTFTQSQLTINSIPISMHNYEIYEENGNYYIKTTPTIFSEDLQLEMPNDKIILTEKFSRRSRGKLKSQ